MADFALSDEELRVVAAYVLASAEEVHPVFVRACPSDQRPATALDAARDFVAGERRTTRQRTTSLDAHRAAREAPDEASRLAARAAGDAASAAYLHPIARAHQVGHVLRAAACAARVAELLDPDPQAAPRSLERAGERATPVLVDVLSRYPSPAPGRQRVGRLMVDLDAALRSG